MAPGDITMHTEETTATATAWRQYADEIEQHGAPDPTVVQQLNSLGDVYHDYKEAKQRELAERASAHQRVANHARLHASRLEATVQAFTEQDETSATSVRKSVAE